MTLPPTQKPSQGIKVGEWWKDRLDCRQWGAHFPHVAGIAGQSNAGAQSVVLSGGCDALFLIVVYRYMCTLCPQPDDFMSRTSDIKSSPYSSSCRYEDDRDEGEWFLYTGSGGRDLSGNKRTNKVREGSGGVRVLGG